MPPPTAGRRPGSTRVDLTTRGTTVRREILAGATTFVTMAYILSPIRRSSGSGPGPSGSARG
jgi:hypothetical protein